MMSCWHRSERPIHLGAKPVAMLEQSLDRLTGLSGLTDGTDRGALALLAGAVTVGLGGSAILPVVHLGPVSVHMVHHIALMNVVAPLLGIVLATVARDRIGKDRGTLLWTAACSQIVLLWAWHAPRLHEAAASSALYAAMLTSLSLAALCFWGCILLLPAHSRWQAIVALVATGKLSCLLGVLLLFAPRLLYPFHSSGHSGHAGIEHQQLAGLLMLIACPLSYVLAAGILTAQFVHERDARSERPDRLEIGAMRRIEC